MFSRYIKAAAGLAFPPELVDDIIAEVRISSRHLRSRLFGPRFRGQSDICVNVGCGVNVAQGWVNLDIASRPGVIYWDCRRSLPFDDNSVRIIFLEHVFEHLTPSAARRFLTECKRCLMKGGILRIIVPDAGLYVASYTLPDWDKLIAARPLSPCDEGYRDRWLDRCYQSKMELLNEVFRQGGEHKYAYDAETLMAVLTESGFERVTHQSFGKSMFDKPLPETPERKAESLYVEAAAPI